MKIFAANEIVVTTAYLSIPLTDGTYYVVEEGAVGIVLQEVWSFVYLVQWYDEIYPCDHMLPGMGRTRSQYYVSHGPLRLANVVDMAMRAARIDTMAEGLTGQIGGLSKGLP